ncbi:hypothetical protein D3C87_1419840 [compost metagenome]|nr:hypothetical protein LMG19282_05532 [Cupriavidus campinensis]
MGGITCATIAVAASVATNVAAIFTPSLAAVSVPEAMATQTGMPSVACDISAADHVRLRATLRPGVRSPEAVRRQRAAARPSTDASSRRL